MSKWQEDICIFPEEEDSRIGKNCVCYAVSHIHMQHTAFAA